MKKKEFAVIGLGRFGGSICKELVELGMEVMAIDTNEDRVNYFSDIVSHAVIADATDETVLRSLGIGNFDHVVVAIGEDIKASILTTMILIDMGVECITAKAQDGYHEKVLKKIGDVHVVHPEQDMGRRVANKIVSQNILDYLELSDDHSIVELMANRKIAGKSIIDLDIRAKFGINIVAIKRGREVNASLKSHTIIENEDILIMVGADKDIDKFQTFLEK